MTRSAGFIGYQLLKSFSAEGHSVKCIYALSETTYAANVKVQRWIELRLLPEVNLAKIDLRFDAIDSLLEEADVVMHAAAVPGLSLSWNNFALYAACKVIGTQKLV